MTIRRKVITLWSDRSGAPALTRIAGGFFVRDFPQLMLQEGAMIRTPICDLLGIEHPIALGGMGTGTCPELVSAVSNAGGLGALGCHGLRPEHFIERWAGQEWALRRDQAAALEGLRAARRSGDIEEGSLTMGQDAGLIRDIPPAGEVVTRVAEEAEEILRMKLPQLLAQN
jgi:NAD(P)H-dependent flavin oxidoreductase YrpB (nitropropane dioxygenase family)